MWYEKLDGMDIVKEGQRGEDEIEYISCCRAFQNEWLKTVGPIVLSVHSADIEGLPFSFC
jgi:hypothetical protein